MDDNILILGQNHHGHRLMYVRLLAQAVLERGDRPVLALTSAGIGSREYELHLEPVADRCVITRLKTAPLSSSSIRSLAEVHQCGRVLVPDGDRFAVRLGVTGWRCHTKVVVLVTQDPRWNTDRRLTRRARLAVKSLVLTRTQRLPRTRLLYLSDHSPAGRQARPSVAPDPVLFDATDDPAELRRRLGLDQHRFWFLVAGHISARKNLPLVIRSLFPLAARGVGLFVHGEIEAAVREEISPLLGLSEELGVPVVIDDSVHTDHEINTAIQAADCVVVAYSSDQPTSMMAKGVRAGRHVVVAGSPWLRTWARNLGIGLTGTLDQDSLCGLFAGAIKTAKPTPRLDLDHTAFVEAFLC